MIVEALLNDVLNSTNV